MSDYSTSTQRDLMSNPYGPALGIADDVAALGLKGSKKKKGRKLDEDFTVRAGHPARQWSFR